MLKQSRTIIFSRKQKPVSEQCFLRPRPHCPPPPPQNQINDGTVKFTFHTNKIKYMRGHDLSGQNERKFISSLEKICPIIIIHQIIFDATSTFSGKLWPSHTAVHGSEIDSRSKLFEKSYGNCDRSLGLVYTLCQWITDRMGCHLFRPLFSIDTMLNNNGPFFIEKTLRVNKALLDYFHTFCLTSQYQVKCRLPQCLKSSKQGSWCHSDTKSYHETHFHFVKASRAVYAVLRWWSWHFICFADLQVK